jgi:uncharacterized membrane protein YciS (DUF1049 family)
MNLVALNPTEPEPAAPMPATPTPAAPEPATPEPTTPEPAAPGSSSSKPPKGRRGGKYELPGKPSEDGYVSPFERQLFLECEAMAQFAFSSGLTVPPSLMPKLVSLKLMPVSSGQRSILGEQTSRRPPDTLLLLEIHAGLSRVVSPAKPRGILLLNREARSRWRFLGPVPLVRQMLLTALLSLTLFVFVGLSPMINPEEINGSILSDKDPLTVLVVESFLLAAAALGASFSGLFQANKYCAEGTFDPKYSSSYWVRFVLGLISGLLLAEVVYFELKPESGGEIGQSPMIKPLLAILGGFSSDLMFRILNRFVSAVESMLRGDPRDLVKEKSLVVQNKAAMDVDQERMRVAGDLMDLSHKIHSTNDKDALAGEVREIVNRLTSSQGKSEQH